MRCTLNIPCLRQLGVIPRFDGYACTVALPLAVFLLLCGLISLNLQRERDVRDDIRVGYTESASSVGVKSESAQATEAPEAPTSDLHYGVIVDCGSSGSRVYVYCWPPHSGGRDELLQIQPCRDGNHKPHIMKIEPGISKFADRPSDAAEYLRPLLDYAMTAVPADRHRETPLYIYSTAGMRMLDLRDQETILSDLRSDIPLWYDFVFSETHTEVISGKQEAIYAWISINYALGRFDHSTGVSPSEPLSLVEVPGPEPTTHVRKQTVGVLDMGGGSLQVAFEVPNSEESAKGTLTEFSLGCTKNDLEHTYRLYVTTFLNFGSNAARTKYEQTLFSNVSQTQNASHTGSPVVQDPCLPVKFREQISFTDSMLTLEGTGNYHECKTRLRSLLNQSAPCVKQPCSISGVYQPEIDFEHSEFYGFSEFFYTMEDLLKIGGSYNYRQFQSMAREFCGHEWSVLEDWKSKNLYPRADQNRYRLQCFKSAWVSMVLHEGLHFPSRYKHLTSVQYIKGEEIHWTIGALLYKTKYYPLREVEAHVVHNYHPPWVPLVYHSNHLIIVCLIVVLAAILVYVGRLRSWSAPKFRRVPTMSYFMTEEGQAHDGLYPADGYSSGSSSSLQYKQYS